MTNLPDARGREPLKDTGSRAEAEPLFPSEGTFSAVVPLSQVSGGRVPVRRSAANAAAPEEPEEPEEEATLVPTRLSPARRASAAGRDAATKRRARHWLATAAAVLLSVTAGVAAGAYLVWTRQAEQTQTHVTQAPDATDASRPAPESAQPEPMQAAQPDAPEAAAPPSVEVVKVERAESVEKPAAEAVKPDPASRREAERRTPEDERRVSETEARAARRARASAETVEATPASKPRREEAAPRRQATPARPNAAAASGRALPVSSPPPSARSRTVIQWP